MAHKTFISYKYSEAQDLRDRIICSLGDDAAYYKGETSESPDLTDYKTETIKRNLCNMMYDTSVTIVIISPNMRDSKWIPWEMSYCLKLNTRKGRTSRRNGIVAVIQKIDGSYDWFKYRIVKTDGCSVIEYHEDLLPNIIPKNRYNQNPKVYSCPVCRSINALTGSYIAYVEEDEFLYRPQYYIENAYNKSENDAAGYDINPTL